jgi:hypothetical protein
LCNSLPPFPIAENVADFQTPLPAAPDKFFNLGSVGAGRGAFADKTFHDSTAPFVRMNTDSSAREIQTAFPWR